MPNCRNCGARLSKFDTDFCPVCGIKEPLKGISSETVEITSQISLSEMSEEKKIVRHRKTLFLYFALLGFTGLPFFYMKRNLLGLIYLLASVALIGGLFSILFFVAHLHPAVAVIIPIAIVYLVSIIIGSIYNFLPNLKDGEGEFIV